MEAHKTEDLKWTTPYAGGGEYNSTLEIEASKEGITVLGNIVIPWEWILMSLATLHREQDGN